MSKPLITKYRPTSLETFVGNSKLKKELRGMLDSKTQSHVYLFSGQSGCGKTTLARIIAKELGVDDLSIIEKDAASNNGIAEVRSIIEETQQSPLYSSKRVYIIDEAHELTKSAQNGLLKVLEDAPEHTYFILCTTEPEKLLKTIISRVSSFVVEPITDLNEYAGYVETIYCLEKGINDDEDSGLSDKFIANLFKTTGGRARETLTNLEKVINLPIAEVNNYIGNVIGVEETANILANLLIQKAEWRSIVVEIKKVKRGEEEKIRRGILGYTNACLLNNNNPHFRKILEVFSEKFFTMNSDLTLACSKIN